jgi:hypothetical protein
MAVEHLRPRLPRLAGAILDGQPYIGEGQGGAVRGSFKGDTFRVVSARMNDGSVIQPIVEGRKSIERTLRKQEISEDAIASALARFDSEPANEPISISPGLEVTKWRIDHLSPALDGPSISEQALLKIAYEFAACHLGALVYDDSAPLRELRAAVWSPSGASSAFSIEYLMSREYETVHGLALVGNSPHTVVTVCLFGLLRYRVHLRGIGIAPPHFSYTHSIESGEEEVDELNAPR